MSGSTHQTPSSTFFFNCLGYIYQQTVRAVNFVAILDKDTAPGIKRRKVRQANSWIDLATAGEFGCLHYHLDDCGSIILPRNSLID